MDEWLITKRTGRDQDVLAVGRHEISWRADLHQGKRGKEVERSRFDVERQQSQTCPLRRDLLHDQVSVVGPANQVHTLGWRRLRHGNDR